MRGREVGRKERSEGGDEWREGGRRGLKKGGWTVRGRR